MRWEGLTQVHFSTILPLLSTLEPAFHSESQTMKKGTRIIADGHRFLANLHKKENSMALQTYWMSPPLTIFNGTGSVNSPVIPAYASVRCYSVLTEHIENNDMGGFGSWIDSYVLKGAVVKAGVPGIAMGPGVSQVHATYLSLSALSIFILMVDYFY